MRTAEKRRKDRQVKDADRLEPKGKWYGRGISPSPLADNDSIGEQVAPNPSYGALAERGKPVFFLMRGKRIVR